MMKNLLDIINNAVEPVYELDAYIMGIGEISLRNKIWEELRSISFSGDIKQRFVALTLISINKPSFLENLSYELIEKTDFAKDEAILTPIVNICSYMAKEKHLNFMLRTLDYTRNKKNGYLFEMTLRNIISTKYWRKVINDVSEIISNYDDITIIDLMAYFIWKQDDNEFNYLLEKLSDENIAKVKSFQNEITKRLQNNYQKIKSVNQNL